MAASYPGAVKEFTDVENFVDDVDDFLVNDLQDEVMAVETDLINIIRPNVFNTKKDLNDVQKTLSTINPNQEETQNSEGFEIISLPKTAGNGNAKATVDGLTLENSIENGDFSDGTTDWLQGNSDLSVVDNIMKATGNGAGDTVQLYQAGADVAIGEKWFIYVKIRVTDAVCSSLLIRWRDTTSYTAEIISTPTQNQWYESSNIVTIIADSSSGRMGFLVANYENAETANGKVMEVDGVAGVFAINMTALGIESYTEPQMLELVQAGYFDGIKSVQTPKKIRSVSADETQENSLYLKGNTTLKSLPNGTHDEIRPDGAGGYELVQRVSAVANIADTVYDSLDNTTYANVDVVKTTAFALATAGTTAINGMTLYHTSAGVTRGEIAQADIDVAANAGKYYYHTDKTVWILTAVDAYADIAAARTALGTSTLRYQLLTPIITPIASVGSLQSYQAGTVYIENVIADGGSYSTKIDILDTALPIKTLVKISTIDYTTGIETELDIADATIAGDGLSFTHTDLASGDIVFFEYAYDIQSVIGNTDIEYYDGRYIIEDTADGKFYSWEVTTTNGTPTLAVTEV